MIRVTVTRAVLALQASKPFFVISGRRPEGLQGKNAPGKGQCASLAVNLPSEHFYIAVHDLIWRDLCERE